MRTTALALLLLTTSCGGGGPAPNRSADQPGPQRMTETPATPAVAITITATGPGGCSASWDGQPVTPAQITERSVAFLERAIAAAGGPGNMTENSFPVPDVEAPAELSIACADTILFALQRSGFASVRLKPAGGQSPAMADFPLDTGLPPPPIPMVLGLGAGGRMTWNSDPIDAAGLAGHLARIGGGTDAPDPVEGGPPPGGLELRVAREATFGQLHELLRRIDRYQIRPFVYLPSAEAGPSGAEVATPPPPLR